jgi:hypothetical protein
MPPRLVVALIGAFWLASVGYLAYHEWWPWLRADSPPPFTVELADEAAPQSAQWSVLRGGQKIGAVTTRMSVRKDDTFELTSHVKNLDLSVSALGFAARVKVQRLVTVQHVTREGKLLDVESRLEMSIGALGQTFDLQARVEGDVRDGALHARCELESPLCKMKQELEPVPLPSGGVLNPMQPVARLKVRPGQRWKITNVDPLGDAINASFRQLLGQLQGATARFRANVSPPRVLLAEVLSEPQTMTFKGQPVSCLVIEYRSADVTGSTWVRESDGKVLKQEVTGFGETVTLLRED